jgi:peptidoglycan/LPS O-acetylase OafA/YrhL
MQRIQPDRAKGASVEQPEQPTPTAFSGQHIKELDGVRAIAIWMVLMTHLFDPAVSASGVFAKVPNAVRFVVHHGYLGVDLFFVLSGFLITGILLRTKYLGTGKYFKRFYTRRALRILPLYFLVIGLIVICVGKSSLPWLGLAALMSANLSDLFGVTVPAPAGPFWSLAVEEQFYLIWPWLVLWLPPQGLVVTTLAILIIEPVLRLVSPGGNFFLTWYHCDGLAIGALVAVWFYQWKGDKRSVGVLIATLIGASVLLSAAIIPYGGLGPGPVAMGVRTSQFGLLAAALVAASVGFSGSPALALLRSRPAVYTALLSYCIYVIHKPLMVLYETFSSRVPLTAHLTLAQTTIAEAFFVIPVAYAIATLSWRYFESPILRRGR